MCAAIHRQDVPMTPKSHLWQSSSQSPLSGKGPAQPSVTPLLHARKSSLQATPHHSKGGSCLFQQPHQPLLREGFPRADALFIRGQDVIGNSRLFQHVGGDVLAEGEKLLQEQKCCSFSPFPPPSREEKPLRASAKQEVSVGQEVPPLSLPLPACTGGGLGGRSPTHC